MANSARLGSRSCLWAALAFLTACAQAGPPRSVASAEPAPAPGNPSAWAARAGFRLLEHATGLENLVPILKDGYLSTTEARERQQTGRFERPRGAQNLLRYGAVFLGLAGEQQAAQPVSYAHFSGDGVTPSDGILVFSLSLLDRPDYHLCRGWQYGRYEWDHPSGAGPGPALCAEVPYFHEGPAVARPRAAREQGRIYADTLQYVSQVGPAQALKENLGEDLKTLAMAKLRQSRADQAALELAFQALAKEKPPIAGPAVARQIVDYLRGVEAVKFAELMNALGRAPAVDPEQPGSPLLNEIAIRAPHMPLRDTLTEVWVPAARRPELLRSFAKFGAPGEYCRQWQGKTWPEVILAPASYGERLERLRAEIPPAGDARPQNAD